MAMAMKGEVVLAADRQTVWTKLNHPVVLKACIPGIQVLDKTSETAFAATVKMKIGPGSATLKGRIELSNIDPPNGYRISGEGEGGIAGFARRRGRRQPDRWARGRQDRPDGCPPVRRCRKEDGGPVLQEGRTDDRMGCDKVGAG